MPRKALSYIAPLAVALIYHISGANKKPDSAICYNHMRRILNILIYAAKHFGIELNSRQLEQFSCYHAELACWNRHLNLTAITEPDEVKLKHFADSLSVIPALGKKTLNDHVDIIDIGTGAGFPGIPLKIALPDIHLSLVDSTRKKLRFVEHIINKLQLENVSVAPGRAEELAHDPDYRERYQVVLSRAVAKLPVLAELCLPFCKINGVFVAYKKGEITEEVASAHSAISTLGGKIRSIQPVTFPGLDDNRFHVVIDKFSPSPLKHPRKPGVPLKKPLS